MTITQLKYVIAVAEHRNVPIESLQGGLGADPVGTLLRSGELRSGLGGGLRDLVVWSRGVGR